MRCFAALSIFFFLFFIGRVGEKTEKTWSENVTVTGKHKEVKQVHYHKLYHCVNCIFFIHLLIYTTYHLNILDWIVTQTIKGIYYHVTRLPNLNFKVLYFFYSNWVTIFAIPKLCTKNDMTIQCFCLGEGFETLKLKSITAWNVTGRKYKTQRIAKSTCTEDVSVILTNHTPTLHRLTERLDVLCLKINGYNKTNNVQCKFDPFLDVTHFLEINILAKSLLCRSSYSRVIITCCLNFKSIVIQ